MPRSRHLTLLCFLAALWLSVRFNSNLAVLAAQAGHTALHAAAAAGNVRVVEVLLENGADVNALTCQVRWGHGTPGRVGAGTLQPARWLHTGRELADRKPLRVSQ